jgi:hypothetical protein
MNPVPIARAFDLQHGPGAIRVAHVLERSRGHVDDMPHVAFAAPMTHEEAQQLAPINAIGPNRALPNAITRFNASWSPIPIRRRIGWRCGSLAVVTHHSFVLSSNAT